MQKEDAIELVQNLKDIREEIVGLLDEANGIVSEYDEALKIRMEIYDLHHLNSDIDVIEKKEGLGQ